jgi:hypothetical protein
MRILKYKVTITGFALFVAIAASLATSAIAQAPKPNVFDNGNRWLITYFNDCDAVHSQWATQGICFLPYKECGACGVQGAWYSDTYPGWRGRYMQEGDHIAMHGNWANFAGSDGMIIDLFAGNSPKDEGAGHWTEWWNSGPYGTTVGFGNTRLRRVGKCQLPRGADISRMSQAEVDKLAVEFSDRVKPRLRKDGKPAASPNDPEQVPLREEREYQ